MNPIPLSLFLWPHHHSLGDRTRWPSGPRPFQVEATAHLLDNEPTLLVAATSSGKTAIFFCSLLVLRHLAKHPRPNISVRIPAKPVVLVVTPLVELGNNHALEMSAFGLRAVSLNAATLKKAREEQRNLIAEIQRCEWSMVFLSAERLTSKDVDNVLRDEFFRQNVIMLGIDEAHVLVPWSQSFRKAYKHVSELRLRLPRQCTLAVVTATLTPAGLAKLCAELDLKPDKYHCIRQSVQRPTVHTILANIGHSLTTASFPDISWIFERDTKAVVFCGSLDLAWRVGLFGWGHYPPGRQHSRVRLWSSITSAQYNRETLALFADPSKPTVIAATVAFGMGMNVPNIKFSINLGLPATLEDLVQQNGRAGRDPEATASGITYIPTATITALKDDIKHFNDESSIPLDVYKKVVKFSQTRSSKATEAKLDSNLRALILAHLLGLCLERVKNGILGSPKDDPPNATCDELGRRLKCSSCDPGLLAALTTSPSAPTLPVLLPPPPPPAAKPFPMTATSLPHSLPKKFKENLALWLDRFALEKWNKMTTSEGAFGPVKRFWKGTSVHL
ncbi:ATP-dependent DNA helicase RecQ [Ephemerocybe angulata]|uniref:DNA 3'-5' helicase n=1 Tax=Ephemerocybe angulata TaxID=980116 RepID=A0A8H6IG53_9AGAR|nr:ATP-dependent DNA helicase RecQ [Tulosesus angulatus]